MKFGIHYPDGDVMSFVDEVETRSAMTHQNHMIETGEAGEWLYGGGVLVAKADGEDEWLEVVDG